MIHHMIYIRRLPVPQARLAIPVLHHTLKVTVRPRKGLRNPSQSGQLQSEQRQRGEPPWTTWILIHARWNAQFEPHRIHLNDLRFGYVWVTAHCSFRKKHPHQRIKKTKKIEVDPKQIDWKHRTGGTVRMEISPSKPPRWTTNLNERVGPDPDPVDMTHRIHVWGGGVT